MQFFLSGNFTMCMRKMILLCLFTALFSNIRGQDDRYIPNPDRTKSEEITQTRTRLLDRFLEKNRIGIILERDKLLTLDDQDYLTLYPVEFWLISYWLEDYGAVLSTVIGDEADSSSHQTFKIPPGRDYLMLKLMEKSNEEKAEILRGINISDDLSSEEKAFLSLHFSFLLDRDGGDGAENEKFNQLSDAFLERYPDSKYAGFIRQHIRVRYAVAKDALIISLFSGKFLFTGNLPVYYTQPTLIGLTLEGLRNSWLYQLNMSVGFGRTKKDMPANNDVWPGGSKAIGGHIDVAFGREFVLGKYINMSPLVGAGIFGLDPNTNSNREPDYKGGGIKTNIAGRAGFIADIKFRPDDIALDRYNRYSMSYAIPSFRIGYDFIATPLKNNFIHYNGTVHRITLGIGIAQRTLKRVY